MTIQLWIKVVIGSIPAAVIGIPFNDFIEEKFNNAYVVAAMLIIYGVLFIVIENYQHGKEPKVKKTFSALHADGADHRSISDAAMIPGTSRSGATIVGALLLGVSRAVAAEFTFFWRFPAMFGASAVKLIHFGLNFTAMQIFLLLLGTVISFAVSIVAIKFLMRYIKKNDFKVFGYYRIVLGIIVLLYFGIKALLA